MAASDAAAAAWADPETLGGYALAPNIADAVAKAKKLLNGRGAVRRLTLTFVKGSGGPAATGCYGPAVGGRPVTDG